jgi:nitrogen fixation/metabolism regulation signal transduction histidine kinase
MHSLTEAEAKALHDVMQPLNIIRLSCVNIRTRMSGYSTEDAQYLFEKMERIEEQVIRATQLLQELKTR